MSSVWIALLPLVEKGPDPTDVKAGWLGFGVVLALAVAVVLLWLSLRRHLKRVDFDEDATELRRQERSARSKRSGGTSEDTGPDVDGR